MCVQLFKYVCVASTNKCKHIKTDNGQHTRSWVNNLVNSIYIYTCTCICQLFVNCFLLFEALMEDWRVVKWVASWNKVFYYYCY